MTPILLLVDLQHDYLAAAGLEPAAGQIVEQAAALLEGCRAAKIPVVHIWTTVSRAEDHRMPHWQRADRWICVEGTQGHATPGALRPADSEPVVHKTFFSGFSSGTLAPILTTHGADTLIIAGIHLHGCVRETVLDAYERGFASIWVADDAVGSDDPVHAAITRRYLSSRAARFAPAAELLARLNDGVSPEDNSAATVAAATTRGRQAWSNWMDGDTVHRRESLECLAVRLEQDVSIVAERMAREIGKPITYGQREVECTTELVRAISKQEIEMPGAGVRRRSVGVIAVITPWNNPVLIPLGKIAAALMFGNTVVWKPAPIATSLAHLLLQHLRAAGIPEEVVSVIPGDRLCALQLMSDPRVDAVSLTGGSQAGYSAQDICARRHIPLQAELGGNNAAIVWPDGDLENAVARIAEGAFGQAGQRCTANRRAIVHADCYDQFLDLLTRAVATMPWGDPLDPATRVGPLVSVKHRDRVAAVVERAARTADRVIVPHGERFPAGSWYPPTIICCPDPSAEIVQEETFGPLLVIQKAGDWKEAIGLCNGVRQGLVAAVFSGSDEIQRRFLQEAQVGVLKINQATADVAAHLPFGGWKASGVGAPEHGIGDREFYTRIQAIYQPPPSK